MNLIEEFNNGKRYGIDWKAPSFQHLNDLVESASDSNALVKSLTNAPDSSEANQVGVAEVSILKDENGYKFKFKNLKGQPGVQGEVGKSGFSLIFSSANNTNSNTVELSKTSLILPAGFILKIGDNVLTADGNVFQIINIIDNALTVTWLTNLQSPIPNLLQTTGQSTTQGMSQKAITDAIEAAFGSEVILDKSGLNITNGITKPYGWDDEEKTIENNPYNCFAYCGSVTQINTEYISGLGYCYKYSLNSMNFKFNPLLMANNLKISFSLNGAYNYLEVPTLTDIIYNFEPSEITVAEDNSYVQFKINKTLKNIFNFKYANNKEFSDYCYLDWTIRVTEDALYLLPKTWFNAPSVTYPSLSSSTPNYWQIKLKSLKALQ